MKIFLLSDGKSIHTKRWIDSLIDHGHDVYLFSLNRILDFNNKNLFVYRGISSLGKLGYILSIPKLNKYLNRVKPDIIHAHYLTGYGIMSGRIKINKPLILSAWGSDVFVTLRSNNLYSKMLRFLVKPALEKAYFITTETKIMADILRNEFNIKGDKLRVIPWGIDMNVFKMYSKEEISLLKRRMGLPVESFIITNVRNIKNFYRIHEIVKAIPHILNSYKDLDVYFILLSGYFDPSYLNLIKKMLKDLRIEKRVMIIEKFLTPPEMADILNISNIIISIPISDSFPISVIEGIACGSIPIVSDTFGTRELSDSSGLKLFFTSGEVNDLAEKIINLIDKYPIFEKEIIPWNLDIVRKKYSWEFSYTKMEYLYMEATNNF